MTFDDAAGKPDQEFTLGRRSAKHIFSVMKKENDTGKEISLIKYRSFAMAQRIRKRFLYFLTRLRIRIIF
jgi:hypothetical protein